MFLKNNPKSNLNRLIILALIGLGLLTACGSQPTPAPTPAAIEPPTISDPKISAPTPQEPGQEVGISVDVSSASGASLTYAWRVDGGEIVRGQGSPAITYRTPDEPGIYNVRVAVMWDDSSVEKITTIRVEAPAVAAADTSVDEPPTDTPTPEPAKAPPTATAPPPTSTLEPTATLVPATPAPTNTPRPTPVPTATIDADPTVYDNFNNPAFDGSFNQGQWEAFSDPPHQIVQQDGILVLTRDGPPNSAAGVVASKYDDVSLGVLTSNTPTFFEAKFMLDPNVHEGNVNFNLRAVLPGGAWWFSQCFITRDGWAGCFQRNWSKETHEFEIEIGQVGYGTWHTVRMEMDPTDMKFTYYFDDEQVGSNVTVEAESLRRAEFSTSISSWDENTGRSIGYFEDIRIGQFEQ